jgi:hypothetical protein
MFEYLYFYQKKIYPIQDQVTSLFLKIECDTGMVENDCICVLSTPKRNGPLLKGKGD